MSGLTEFIISDREKILNYISKKWKCYESYKNDIFNEIIIIFLNETEEVRNDIILKNKLNRYFIRVANWSLSNTGCLFYKYRHNASYELLAIDLGEEIYDEIDYSKIKYYIKNKLLPFQKKIWDDYLDGMKIKDIAEKYNVTPKYIGIKLKEIRLILRKLI